MYMGDEPFYDDNEDAEGEDEENYMRSSDPDSDSDSESELEVVRQIEHQNDLEDGVSQAAEIEIEGDFDRLIANIREADGASGSNMMTRDWDFNIEERDAEFRDDLRAASGIGRTRRKADRQSGPVLSQQVKALVGEGNQAFVDNDIPSTIRIMQEVIRIEPRAPAAWSVLAQCYSDMKEPKKELQLRIMAAHLRHDADEWDRLARSSKELGYNQQALYCYRKLYSLDPTNVDALWDRAALAKEMGNLRTARHSYLAILKRFPHDLTVLSELRPLLIELSDLQTCANLFQSAFEHYSALFPVPFNSTSASAYASLSIISPFAQMEVLCLTDLYNTLGQHGRAIEAIKRGWRWLQGRAADKFWDACEDDREFDLMEDVGSTGLGAGGGGTHRERDGDVRPGWYPLDVNARHRLAIARIKMGDVDEGKMHANIVLSQDILDYSPLFVEIADAYFDQEMYKEASPLYEVLGQDAATSNFSILLNAAACRRMLGNMREAVELYKTVIEADPTHNEAKMKLAELYEIMDEPRKALDLVYQVIDSRGKNRNVKELSDTIQVGGAIHASLFEETPRSNKGKTPTRKSQKLTPPQLRELEEQKEKEVIRGYKRVEELWSRMLDDTDHGRLEAEREWMFEAEKLVEMFRETRMLFLATRTNPFRGMLCRRPAVKRDDQADEDRMATRLELMEQTNNARKSKDNQDKPAKVDVFRGVSFDNWLRLFMQYAFQLTRGGQYELADEVLRHISFSNAYQNRETQDTIRFTLIACAIATGQHLVVVEQCRKLIITHQFNNEPVRILLASLASGLRPTDSFIISTLQKHLLRELKINDTAVKNPDTLRWVPVNRRYAMTSTKSGGEGEDPPEEDDVMPDEGSVSSTEKQNVPRMPTKFNPIPLIVYGQMCTVAKSYQSAIFYLLHGYDYCPDDPVICLSLAIASIGRAMQRQSDNRHHLVTQGMAFLSRYRALRKTSPEGIDEIEFNFGRAFQQLGLHSHAAQHYERVLELAERKSSDDPGLAREAAYNLGQLYAMTGAIPLAQAIYRKWLSL